LLNVLLQIANKLGLSNKKKEEKVFARPRLGKRVLGATNTHAKIKELLRAVFSVRSLLFQRFNT
jgi:hypothetical protein